MIWWYLLTSNGELSVPVHLFYLEGLSAIAGDWCILLRKLPESFVNTGIISEGHIKNSQTQRPEHPYLSTSVFISLEITTTWLVLSLRMRGTSYVVTHPLQWVTPQHWLHVDSGFVCFLFTAHRPDLSEMFIHFCLDNEILIENIVTFPRGCTLIAHLEF